jgi:5-methylcytosine-specific restriction endonuclease McrA
LKNHTKVYCSHFGYILDEFIFCEVCGARAVDLHHIFRRGMGGSKSADTIENIMALCRKCHIEYGDKKQYMEFLKEKHKDKLDGKR